jgi:hypothetical protein
VRWQNEQLGALRRVAGAWRCPCLGTPAECDVKITVFIAAYDANQAVEAVFSLKDVLWTLHCRFWPLWGPTWWGRCRLR